MPHPVYGFTVIYRQYLRTYYFEVKRSKVKVIRPINAVTDIAQVRALQSS